MERLLKNMVFGVVLVSQAYAEASSNQTSTQANKVSYEKRTKIDFSEKSVDGDFMSPDSSAVGGDKNIEFDSLLEPKGDFKKELKRSSKAAR